VKTSRPEQDSQWQGWLGAAYEFNTLAWTLSIATLLTAAPWVLATFQPPAINPSLPPAMAALAGPSYALVWLLLALWIPAVLWVRKSLKQGTQAAFERGQRLQSFLQFSWLQLLVWFAVPWFPTAGIALVVALMACWAAIDAMSRLRPAGLRLHYLLVFPAFDGLLLLMDAAGGPGLLAVARVDPGYVAQTLALQVGLVVLTQAVMAQVGRHMRPRLAWQQRREASERRAAVMAAEKDVIAQSSVLLGHGLAASQFSHDVASPITVMRAASEELEMLLDEFPPFDRQFQRVFAALPTPERQRIDTVLSSWEASNRQVLRDLNDATKRTLRMTSAMAHNLSSKGSLNAQVIGDLVDSAVDAMGAHLRGHDRLPPNVLIQVEPASVLVSPGHAGILGNLMTNGALHAPGEKLDVMGKILDPWFYRLTVRDHGVTPKDRPAALRSIRRSLQIGPAVEGDRAEQDHRGYGIALMLAKVLVVRHHGWIAAAAPESGRGVALHVVLPRVEPHMIPASAGHPGRHLAELQQPP
jgi:signal transduction histidine kinase